MNLVQSYDGSVMRIYALVEGLSFVGVLILLFLLEGSNVLG